MKKITKIFAVSFFVLFTASFSTLHSQVKLYVKDISSPALNFNVGNTEELVYLIKNIGSAGSRIDTILFQCHQPSNIWFYPTGTGNEKYYLTYPSYSVLNNYYTRYTYPSLPAITYSLDSISTQYNVVTPSMITSLIGHGYLGSGDSLIIHIPYYVLNCNNTGGSTYFKADSAGTRTAAVIEPISVSVTVGQPTFTGTPNIFDSAYFCSSNNKDTAEVGFKITNTDPTSHDPVLPYADSLRLYFYCDTVATMDTSTFRINGVKISGKYIKPYVSNGTNLYLIKMYKFPAGIHGDTLGNNTLMDLSGGGKADDLAQNQSFELTATIHYHSGCPAYASCNSYTTWTLPGFVATWNNQCNTSTIYPDSIRAGQSPIYGDEIRYFYQAGSNASSITTPSDITNTSPDFNATVCINDYQQSWTPKGFAFDCPHADWQLVMPMPRGYHLDTALLRPFSGHYVTGVRSRVFKFLSPIVTQPFPGCGGASYTDTNTNVQEFFTPTDSADSIVINFDSLPLSSGCNGTYVPNCFNVPLALNCSNFDTANVNIEPDVFNYRYNYICDNVSPCNSCPDVLACGNTTAWHHCAGLCSFPPYTTQGWIMDRTNFGDSNQNSPSFYDNCGGTHGIVPGTGDIVKDTIPVDSSSAYPGDQMKILVNGGFIDKPNKYQNIYLQVRYGSVGVTKLPYYLFELDQTDTSYFIVKNCKKIPAMNGVHLKLPQCPAGYRSCNDYYNGLNTDGMNFSLFSAIKNTNPTWYDSIIVDDSNENMTIAAHMYVRVRNDSLKEFLHYPDYLQYGKNVINLRTEYMAVTQTSGDTVPSCDPWGGRVTLLEPLVGLGLTSLIGGNPASMSTCDTFDVQFYFIAQNVVTGQDDFPYELRPVAELDSVVTITLPKGYTYAGTQFSTSVDNYNSSTSDNHFARNSTFKYFGIKPFSNVTSPITHKTTLTYKGLDSNGTYCWPLFDEKYTGSGAYPGYYLTVKTLPSCKANNSDTLSCVAGFRVGTQQSDTNYQVHIRDTMIKTIITHENPVDYVVTPPSVSDYSDTIKFSFTLCDSLFDAPIPWVAFENVHGYLLNMATVKVYDKTTSTSYSSGYQYFNSPDNAGVVFDLNTLGAHTCDSLVFSAVIEDSSRACPPTGALAKMLVRFGNICDGDKTIKNPDSAHCENRVDTFYYHVYPTSLSLVSNGYTHNTCLKGGLLVDSLVLENTNQGTIINPRVFVYPPIGTTLDSVRFTYPCDTINFTPHPLTSPYNHVIAADTTLYTGGGGGILGYGWFLDKDLSIDGLPGSLANPSGADNSSMCLKVYMTMSCNYAHGTPIKIKVTGISTCNALLQDSVMVSPIVDDSCCMAVCVTHKANYNVVINNADAHSLHAGLTVYSCDSISITGTYTVDENVIFDNCAVGLAPHALIVVDSGYSLTIQSDTLCSHGCNHLYAACDTTWRGIFVKAGAQLTIFANALVEDADTAIYAENKPNVQATYTLEEAVINKCYKDIVLRNYNHYYTGYADECLFTCRNFSSVASCYWRSRYHSAPPTTLLPPFSSSITAIGWQIDSIGHFEDNGYAPAIGGVNVFDNLTEGIYSYRSNLVICSDTFQYIRSGTPALHAIGGVPDSIYVGGPNTYGQPNVFLSCKRAIEVIDTFSSVNIVYNKFEDSTTDFGLNAIIIDQIGPHITASALNIEGNKINNYVQGIVCNLNNNVNATIIYDTITGELCDTSQWVGIAINEATAPTTALYTIDANIISIMHYGILANDVYNPKIVHNTITLGNFTPHCAAGYYVGYGINETGCTGGTIGCNTINGPTTLIVNPNTYKGIVEKQSTGVSIINNSTSLTDVHIEFRGTPSTGDGANLHSNTLTGAATAVDTGIDDLGAGITDYGASGNTTDNTFSGSFSCTLKNTPVSLVTNYWFSSTVLYTPPSPYCNAASFTNKPNHTAGSNPCSSVPALITNRTARVLNVNSPDTVPLDSSTIASMLNTALSKDVFNANQDTNMLLAKIGVLTVLWSHPYLLANATFSHFNDSMSQAPIGRIMAIDTAMVSTYGNVNYSNLYSSLNTISPNNNIEYYLQVATQGYLDYTMNSSLSIGEITTLRTVANLCPDYNGYGVYLARSLVSLYDAWVTIYPDYCKAGGNERRLEPNEAINQTVFNVYPNPNKGGFTVQYGIPKGQTGQLIIYTLLGQKEAEYVLDANSNTMNITDNSLSNGLYLYVIRVNNNDVKRDKLIIIK